ncbi:MAG: oligosaccharide flippase family protein [Saprospiraceae bacterium]
MGIITRQGFKHTVVNYVGAAIGLLTTLFVYPLQMEAYGLAQFLMATAVLFIPLTVLGAQSLPIRFFHRFEDPETGHNGFVNWLLLLCLGGGLLTAGLTWIFWERIIAYYATVSPLYPLYLIFFLPILILRGVIQVLNTYISNFHRIVVPSILNDLLIKITLPVFVLLVYSGWWSYRELVIGLVLHFVAVFLGLIIYLNLLGHWSLRINWPAFKGPILGEMREFAVYGILGSMGASVAMNLDIFMISSMISPEATGIYSIAAVMANLINRPLIAITAISAPIIMKAWKEGNRREIETIYQKSAINSLIPGVLLFLLIVLNLQDLYALMPNSDVVRTNELALILLGGAYLINLATGVNAEMMVYSDLFKWHFYTVLILALLNLILNFFLIRAMGITGAALATLISYTVYNLCKGGIVWYKHRMHPFTNSSHKILWIGLGIWIIVNWLPSLDSAVLSIGIRSILITSLYFGLVYLLKLSIDFNELIDRFLSRLKV